MTNKLGALGKEDLEHVDAFNKNLNNIIETYVIQNAKYGSSWTKDGLDARILFCEIHGKYCRLRQLMWKDWDKIKGSDHRARIVETLNDLILYALMINRRIETEEGAIDPTLVRKMVEKT
jgi:hypothetical protein